MRIVDYTSVKEGVPYVPDFLDNRKLPAEEQLVVYIRPFSNADAMKWQSQVKIIKAGRKGEMETNSTEVEKRIFIRHVVKIENFELVDPVTGAVEKCDSPGVMFEKAPKELIEEILMAIQDRSVLDDGKKKD